MTTNEIITLVVAAGSLLVAAASAWFAWQSAQVSKRQLALVERKIGMVDDPAKMTEILPGWYVERMSNDYTAISRSIGRQAKQGCDYRSFSIEDTCECDPERQRIAQTGAIPEPGTSNGPASQLDKYSAAIA